MSQSNVRFYYKEILLKRKELLYKGRRRKKWSSLSTDRYVAQALTLLVATRYNIVAAAFAILLYSN